MPTLAWPEPAGWRSGDLPRPPTGTSDGDDLPDEDAVRVADRAAVLGVQLLPADAMSCGDLGQRVAGLDRVGAAGGTDDGVLGGRGLGRGCWGGGGGGRGGRGRRPT